ncbi:FK506-binding protein-like isoform X2 [Dermochelys coriacea]|nr:FK506-binding protein-like isoform X2 [Dermochelys coriacea]XP_038226879.1 FK506-binding protein-like isoform X2 [Dermochelys coriacea]XP_038226880.1 FK506-binding protein-like isoform X2 [Dermochelys coriacea]
MEAMAVANGKADGDGAANGMSSAGRGAESWGARAEEDQRENLEVPNQPADAWVAPDGAFTKQVLQPGTGLDKPTLGALCQVFLEAPPGAPLGYPTDRWAQLELGEGDRAWDDLVDACLETMVPGERAELWAPGRAVLGLHLASFAPVPEPWQLDPAEKWALALRHKERGSELYRAGEVGAAARRYTRALQLAIAGGPAPPAPEHARLRADLHANLAACQLRLAQPAHAARNCTKALALRPQHTKARYRHGLARAAMNDLEGAAEDFRGVLAAEPGNTAACRELERVGQRARERDARLAQAMSKLFS